MEDERFHQVDLGDGQHELTITKVIIVAITFLYALFFRFQNEMKVFCLANHQQTKGMECWNPNVFSM